MIKDRQIRIFSTSRHIVLIGYRCTGKTTVGRLLAGKTGREFADTDRVIEEKSGINLEEIIQSKGWEGFRAMERKVVEELSAKAPMIIATGGGTMMDAQNVKTLKKSGWVLWLRTHAFFLKERMLQELALGRIRPPLTGKDPVQEIETVLAARLPGYEAACDAAIDTEGLTAGDVANDILNKALLHYRGLMHAG